MTSYRVRSEWDPGSIGAFVCAVPLERNYASSSFTGSPVRSSSELAILIGRPIGLMYSFVQSIPSVL